MSSKRFQFMGVLLTEKRARDLLDFFRFVRFVKVDTSCYNKRFTLDVLNVFRCLRYCIRRDFDKSKYYCFGVSFSADYLEDFDNLLRDVSVYCHVKGNYKTAVWSIFFDVLWNLVSELKINLGE